MNIEDHNQSPARPAAVPPRTKNQLRASALADALAVKAKWKSLIGEAQEVWPQLHTEELATVAGNFHVLAGLVQLRCRLSRADSDQQARAFLDRHYAVVGATVRPL